MRTPHPQHNFTKHEKRKPTSIRSTVGLSFKKQPSFKNGNTEIKKSVQNGANRSTVKFWRPRHDTRGQLTYRSNNQVLEEDATSEKGTNQTLPAESHRQSCDLNGNDSKGSNDSDAQVEDGAKPEGMPFYIDAAKAFLAQTTFPIN